jgi:hypothetical protein
LKVAEQSSLADAASDAPSMLGRAPRSATTLTESTASLDPVHGKFDQDQTSAYNLLTCETQAGFR